MANPLWNACRMRINVRWKWQQTIRMRKPYALTNPNSDINMTENNVMAHKTPRKCVTWNFYDCIKVRTSTGNSFRRYFLNEKLLTYENCVANLKCTCCFVSIPCHRIARWNSLYFSLRYQSNLICLQYILARFVISWAIKIKTSSDTLQHVYSSCYIAWCSRISTHNLLQKQWTRLGCHRFFFHSMWCDMLSLCIKFVEHYLDYALVTLRSGDKRKTKPMELFVQS